MDKIIKSAYDKLDDETKKHLGKFSISEAVLDSKEALIQRPKFKFENKCQALTFNPNTI